MRNGRQLSLPARAFVLVTALLAFGCSRTGLGAANRQVPADATMPPARSSADAGASAPLDAGLSDGAASAPRDAGPSPRDAGPPRNDGGPGPRPALDASMPDASVSDAAGPAETAPDPTPLRAPGDVVFSLQAGTVTSLYAMSAADFTLRKLDPAAPTVAISGTPLGYSPDGQKLVVAQYTGDATSIFVAYRCRQAACAGAVEPYREVLRIPNDAPLSETSFAPSAFAPDSSGMALQVDSGAFYLPFEADEPASALRLSETPFKQVYFVAGSRGLLVEQANPAPSRVELVDLRSWQAGATPHHTLTGSDGVALSHVMSVSPDGQHWLADPRMHAFAAADVLAGELAGRALAADVRDAHAGDQWLALLTASGVRLQRWDASEELAVAGTASRISGCGNRTVIAGGAALQSLDLSGVAPPVVGSLPGAPSLVFGFAGDCAKVIATDELREHPMLVDLGDGSAIENPYWTFARFNDHATLSMLGYDGIQSTVRVDTYSSAEPLWYRIKRAFYGPPVFAHEGLFFIAAAPLLDLTDPRIYRVDFSDPARATVEPLSHTAVSASAMVLSSDDRHLAYGVTVPRVPVVLADVGEGTFEVDLQTRESAQVAVPSWVVMGGTQRWQPIPEHRALLVSGSYAGQPREAFYVADLDSSAFVSQQPVEAAPRVLDSVYEYLSPDGSTVWYRALAASSSRFAQPLRFGADQPLAPAGVLSLAPQTAPDTPADVTDETFGFAQGIGPIYGHHTYNSAPGSTDESAIFYFDLEAGEERVLAHAAGDRTWVDVAIIGKRTGRVVLWRGNDNDNSGQSLSLVEAGALETEQLIAAGTETLGGGLSPDERWFEYTTDDDADGHYDVHFYDLESHVDRRVSYAQLGSSVRAESFQPTAPVTLLLTAAGKLFAVDLEGTDDPMLVAEGVHNYSFSDDRRWAVWSTADGAFLTRLDGSLKPQRLLSATSPGVQISASGRWLLTRDATNPWRLWRTDAIDAGSVELSDSANGRMVFDPNERYVAGDGSATGTHPLTVWKLDDPATPHHVMASGTVTQWSWVAGPLL